MSKKALTETDIRTKFITPAIIGKWDVMTQVREEVFFTKGRVIVRGKTVRRGEAKKADYILYYKPNMPIAVVEAKDNRHTVGAGMQCGCIPMRSNACAGSSEAGSASCMMRPRLNVVGIVQPIKLLLPNF